MHVCFFVCCFFLCVNQHIRGKVFVSFNKSQRSKLSNGFLFQGSIRHTSFKNKVFFVNTDMSDCEEALNECHRCLNIHPKACLGSYW